MAELFSAPLPAEPIASCDACPMLAPSGEHGKSFFHPASKCCTYEPALANFLVGRILVHGKGPGRVAVERRLERRVDVSPLELRPPAQFRKLYAAGGAVFGKASSLRCPYYLEKTGGCGIWQHRNAVCATWFCKHERGEVGLRFWQALQQAFTEAERALARWCVLELGLEASALRELFPHPLEPSRDFDADDLDGRTDEARERTRWGRWYGREKELFIRSSELVDSLSWADVARIGGSNLAVRVRIAVDALGKLTSARVDRPLKARPLHITEPGPKQSQVTTYSQYDPLELPNELIAALPAFDGGPLARSLQNVERRHGLSLEPELLHKLVDFGVLEEVGASAPKASPARRPRRPPR